ncbi:MAG: ATP-binding cassette domain-containing protein, partial [Bacilli bacterium]|nr:ATP-binding cassette domain-containing protein [Bacilli bacterium]
MSIKFNDVSFIYSPKSPFSFEALKNVNVEIKEGSFTAIVGHTGSGKSTLVQHINGLNIPTSGTVEIGEFLVSKKSNIKKIKNLRKYAGIVFQFPEYQLFEETIEKDVAFG